MDLRALDEGFWLGMIGWVFIVIGLIFVRVTIAKVREDPARASVLRALVWLLPFAAFAGFGALLIYVGQVFY